MVPNSINRQHTRSHHPKYESNNNLIICKIVLLIKYHEQYSNKSATNHRSFFIGKIRTFIWHWMMLDLSISRNCACTCTIHFYVNSWMPQNSFCLCATNFVCAQQWDSVGSHLCHRACRRCRSGWCSEPSCSSPPESWLTGKRRAPLSSPQTGAGSGKGASAVAGASAGADAASRHSARGPHTPAGRWCGWASASICSGSIPARLGCHSCGPDVGQTSVSSMTKEGRKRDKERQIKGERRRKREK